MRKWIRQTFIIALVGVSSLALAQDKTLRIILPFPAGGSVDAAGRVVGEHLAKALGRTVVVENKPGADGAIATMAVISAPADGSTLLFGTNTAIVGVPTLRKSPPYDPLRDLAPVTLLAAGPLMRFIGNKGEAVITRLLGVLLAALAAQFVIDGLKASFPALG